MPARPVYTGPADLPTQQEFLAFAQQLAQASAAVIRPYFRSGFSVETKADASPVTIADRKAEETMRKLIMQTYPDHGILGEEFGEHQPAAAYRWVLDPIDGTKSFVAGTYLFGTLIALQHQGRPIVGAIHHPIPGDLLLGTYAGTWLNDQPVSVRACTRIEDALLLTTSLRSVAQYASEAAFSALTARSRLYRTWGDCHGYFLVATGGADIMADPIMNPWDVMALVPVIEGAGGRITDWQGNDPVVGHSAIATGGFLHDEVVRALNQGMY